MGKMIFKRYIEIGRIVKVNYGSEYGKILCIVDILDHNRALVDGPGELRCQMPFSRLAITDLKIDIPRGARKKTVEKVFLNSDILNKFAKKSWGQKEKKNMKNN